MIRTYRLTDTDLFMRRWPFPARRIPIDTILWRHVDRFKGTFYLVLETKDGAVFSISDLTPSGKDVSHRLQKVLRERGIPPEPHPDSKIGRRLRGSIRGVFRFALFLAIFFLFASVGAIKNEEPLEHLAMFGGLFLVFSILAYLCARKLT